MKFKLSFQKIDKNLKKFLDQQIKQNRIYVPRVSKKNLKEVVAIAQAIQEEGLPSHLILRKLPGKLGDGIFLHPEAKPIPKGHVIAPYAGRASIAPQNHGENSDYTFSLVPDLKLTKEEQKIWDRERPYHPRRVYSIDLDAEREGNFTRFINHSSKPNIEAVFLRIPKSLEREASFEIIYIAKKPILPGEQLLVSYEADGDSYWGAMGIKPVPMSPRTFLLDAHLQVGRKSKK